MHPIKFVTLLILTTLLMGSSYTVVKLGLDYAPPLFLAALRFLSAGLIMAVTVYLLAIEHPKKLSAWLKICIIGSFQTAGVMGAIFLSLHTISASESSILTFINPLLVVIIGTLFFTTHYRKSQWIGVLIGFIGVIITLGSKISLEIGVIYGLISALFWALATLLVNRWRNILNAWVLAAYQMLFGGSLLLIASLIFETPYFIFTPRSVTILIWLSLISSIVQFAVWYYLLLKSNPGKTSSYLFLAPFFGVITGWLVLDDPLSQALIFGGLFIVVGIYLVNRTPNNPQV